MSSNFTICYLSCVQLAVEDSLPYLCSSLIFQLNAKAQQAKQNAEEAGTFATQKWYKYFHPIKVHFSFEIAHIHVCSP